MKGDLEAVLAPAVARFVKAEHPALHPGRSARIELNGRAVGWIGELHPRWMQKYDLPHAPILFEIEAEALMQRVLPIPAEVSKFPPVRRDIAVVVDQKIEVQALLDELQKAQSEDGLQDCSEGCAFRRIPSKIKHFRWSGCSREKPCVPCDLARYWRDPSG